MRAGGAAGTAGGAGIDGAAGGAATRTSSVPMRRPTLDISGAAPTGVGRGGNGSDEGVTGVGRGSGAAACEAGCGLTWGASADRDAGIRGTATPGADAAGCASAVRVAGAAEC